MILMSFELLIYDFDQLELLIYVRLKRNLVMTILVFPHSFGGVFVNLMWAYHAV